MVRRSTTSRLENGATETIVNNITVVPMTRGVATVSEKFVVWTIPIDAIKDAPYNPPRRTYPENKHIVRLAQSIKAVKQQVPVVVYPLNDEWSQFGMCEGHRRKKSAKMAGETTLECIVIDREAATALYVIINQHVERHSANDMLNRFLRDRCSVGDYHRSAFTNMIRVVTRQVARKMGDRGYSFATYKQALTLATYCGRAEDADYVQRILHWLMDHQQTFPARKAKEQGVPATKFMWAIENDRPICEC